jgi:hypothetical protein
MTISKKITKQRYEKYRYVYSNIFKMNKTVQLLSHRLIKEVHCEEDC